MRRRQADVSNELPDLDEDVSFVVDQGAPVGPMPLRSIIDSIRSGERAPDVLVWWAGASDWVSFANEAELFALLQELPATDQPPPPPPAEPEEDSFEEADLLKEAVVASVEDPDEMQDDTLDLDDDHDFEVPESDPIADAEAEWLLTRDSRAMHPSSRWGLDAEEADEIEDGESLDRVAAVEIDGVTPLEIDQVAEADQADEVDEEEVVDEPEAVQAEDQSSDFGDLEAVAPAEGDSVVLPSGFSGLFGAPARTDAGLTGVDPQPGDESSPTVRSSLESVGARIDALTSATRRVRQQLDVRNGAEPPGDSDAPKALDLSPEPEAAPRSEPDRESGSWQAVHVPDLDQRFADMVAASIERQRRLDWALRVDELLLSACITAVVDSGFVLLDLATNESDHRALFDHNDDSRHVRLDISPLSPLNVAGEPVGRHVRVSMAWGREVADADAAFRVVRSEASDGEATPGTFTCEMNMVSSSASTCVDLIWTADEFVQEDQNVDRAALDASIAAILYALEQRWHELFDAAY